MQSMGFMHKVEEPIIDTLIPKGLGGSSNSPIVKRCYKVKLRSII
jgi:hypothetical protein